MCFSLQASLLAGTGLAVLSYFSLKEIRARRQILFASVPLLFSLQQFSESLIWANMNGLVTNLFIKNISVYAFLTFAFLIWPFYIPLSIYVLEPKKNKKKVLGFITVFGAGLSLVSLFFVLKNGAAVTVINSSICYIIYSPINVNFKFLALYLVATTLPLFISSINNMQILGILSLLSCFVAYYFWSITFISVWCFFAAILSGFIIFILKNDKYHRL